MRVEPRLVDLLYSSGAVDEFLDLVFVDEVVGDDEREQRHCLPRPRRHLQHPVTLEGGGGDPSFATLTIGSYIVRQHEFMQTVFS